MSRQGAQPRPFWAENGQPEDSGRLGTASETPTDDLFAGPFYRGPKFQQPPPSFLARTRVEESPFQSPAAGGGSGPGQGYLDTVSPGPLASDGYQSGAAAPSGARRGLFGPLDGLQGALGGQGRLDLAPAGPEPGPNMGYLGQDVYAAAPAAQPWGLADDQEMEDDSDSAGDAGGLPLSRQELPEPRLASGFGFGGPAGGFAAPAARPGEGWNSNTAAKAAQNVPQGQAPFFLPYGGGPPIQSGPSGPSISGFSSTAKPPRPEGMQDLIRAKRRSNDSGLPPGPQAGPLAGPGCFVSPPQNPWPGSMFSCPGGAAGSVFTSPETSPPRDQIIGLVGPPSIKEQHRQAESSRMKALSLPTPNAARSLRLGVGWASAGAPGVGGGDTIFDTGSSSAAASFGRGRGPAFLGPGGGESDPSQNVRLMVPPGGPVQPGSARARGPHELGWTAAHGSGQAPPLPGAGPAAGGNNTHVVGANRRIRF